MTTDQLIVSVISLGVISVINIVMISLQENKIRHLYKRVVGLTEIVKRQNCDLTHTINVVKDVKRASDANSDILNSMRTTLIQFRSDLSMIRDVLDDSGASNESDKIE